MTDIASLNIRINSLEAKQAKTELDQMTRSGDQAERKMGSMSKAAARLGAALAAAFATYQITKFTKEVAMAAARYETLGVVLNQVGRNAGYSAAEVNRFSDQIRESGIQMDTARQVTIRMIQAQVDMTKASKLARIAQDAAVIGNINSSEALERMIHGIQSAQIEVLRGIGINVNFENSYKKLADQLGITTKELSEQQKMQARTNVVLEQGARIAGVYEESMSTAGKQISSFIRYVNDFKIQMGQAFNPATAEVVKSMTAAMKDLTEAVSSPETQRQLGLIADEVGEWVSKNAELFAQDLPNHLRTAANAAELAGKGLLAVGSGMSLVINGFMSLPDWVKSVGIVSAILFGKKAALVIGAISAVIGKIKELNSAYTDNFESQMVFLKEHKKYLKSLGMDTSDVDKKIQALMATMDAMSTSVGKFGTGIGEGQFGDVPLILEKIKDNAPGAVDGVKDLVDQFSYLNHTMYEADFGDASDWLAEYKQLMDLKDEIGYMEDWISLVESGLTTQEATLEIERQKLAIRLANTDLNPTERQHYIDLLDDIDRLTQAEKDRTEATEEFNRKQEKARQKYEREWERVYDDMHKFAADTFYDIFDGQLDSFEDFADSMLDIFKRMLANMAAEAAMTNIFKPLMRQMAGSALGNMLGLPSLTGGSGSGLLGSLGTNIASKVGMNAAGSWLTGSGNLANAWGVLGQQTGLWGGNLANGISTYSAASGVGAGQFGGVSQAGGLSGGGAGLGALGVAGGFAAMAGMALHIANKINEDNPSINVTNAPDMTGMKPWAFGAPSKQFDYRVGVKDTGQDPQIQKATFEYFDTLFTGIEDTIGISMNDVLEKHGRLAVGSSGSIQSLSNNMFSSLIGNILDEMFPDVGTVAQEYKYPTGKSETYYSGRDGLWEYQRPIVGTATRQVSALTEHLTDAFFQSLAPEGGLWEGFGVFADVAKTTEGFVDDLSRRIFDLGQTAEEAFGQIQLVTGVLAEMDMAIEQISGTQTISQINVLSDTWNAYINVMEQAKATAKQLTDAESKKNLVVGSQISGLNASSIATAIGSGKTAADIASEALQTLINEQLAQSIFDDLTPILEDMGQVFVDTGGDIGAAIIALEQYTPAIRDLFDGLQDGIEAITGYDIQNILDLKNYGLSATGDMWTQYQDVWGDHNVNYDPNNQSGQANWLRWFTKSSAEEITDWIDTADIAGDDFVSMMRDMIDLERDLADARSDAKRSIEDLINDLTFSDLAPVTSMGRYQTQYDRLTSQIEGASTAEEVSRAIDQFTAFVPDFLNFAAAFGGDYGSVYQGVMSDLENYGASFDGGGVVSGPQSGYTMPVTFHGTEHISTDSDMKDVKALLTRLVNMSHEGGNVQVVVKVGEREIRDMTFDVIRTDPGTQQQIRRVAHV